MASASQRYKRLKINGRSIAEGENGSGRMRVGMDDAINETRSLVPESLEVSGFARQVEHG
jgi:hypothetical protein